MNVQHTYRRRRSSGVVSAVVLAAAVSVPAQQMVTETRDPEQPQDEEFAKVVAEWTTQPVLHQPARRSPAEGGGHPLSERRARLSHRRAREAHVPTPTSCGTYRALAAATPRVTVETIGRSDEDRELVVVWVSSDENMKNLQKNRDNLAKIADPRGLSPEQIRQLIAGTRPHYHLMGGLHSGETGPSEMLMELVYRLATETSPLIRQIRDNVVVSVTPVADADGRDRNVDWFNRGLETPAQASPAPGAAPADGSGRGGSVGALPYWGKYVYHDNNRDINLSQMSMRALADWYFTAHPPIMHDLHESLSLMYTYSGGAPQNPNLDPILFAELPWFSNFELAQMTKWGMPGVYTYAFMDGWSPGYLGSIAYNHNGMMRMYETQSGREPGQGAGAVGAVAGRGGDAERSRRCRRGSNAGRRHGDGRRSCRARRGIGAADRPRRRTATRVVSRAAGATGSRRELLAPQQHELHADRCPERAAADRVVPEPRRRELLSENEELDRVGENADAARLRDSRAARHDARRGARQRPPAPAD